MIPFASCFSNLLCSIASYKVSRTKISCRRLKRKESGSENAMIFIDGESYFMENSKPGEFQFKITKPMKDVVFHVEGNAISSEEYQLIVVAVQRFLILRCN
jgi:hypothetical protein